MLTVFASSMQLILRTERDLQGPWVHEGEGKLSPPLSQVLPVGKPSAMWVSSSGPDMLPSDSASCPKTASRPPDRTGRGSNISRWGEEGPTPSASPSLPVVLLMLPSEGPGKQFRIKCRKVLSQCATCAAIHALNGLVHHCLHPLGIMNGCIWVAELMSPAMLVHFATLL